jgi:hypothetical protein
VSVRAPKGVEVTGDTSATVAGAAITKTGVLEVTVHAVPKEPLYLVVDGRSKHAGYHAEIPYRFGQPAPRVAEPVRGKEPVKVNGVDLGRPVMMP